MPFITARVLSVVRDDTAQALAEAGENQSVLCAATVFLEGEILLDDVENHTFEWEQTFGTPVTLINPTTLTPSFVNPQISDIEFTLYVDRNTPFEDSDVILITRRPQAATAVSFGASVLPSVTHIGAGPAQIQTSSHFDANATVMPLAFTKPPATYSPLYSADDVDRIRQWPAQNYWMMNDIDLSSYSNWDPIGTTHKPFTGDFQGNGFVIDNLTITDTPIADSGGDEFASSVTMNNDWEGTDGDTFYTGPFGDSWAFFGGAEISNTQVANGSTSLGLDGISGTRVETLPGPGLFGSGDFTIECNAYRLTSVNNQYMMNINAGVSDRTWSVRINTSSNFAATIERSSSGPVTLLGGVGSMTIGSWNHWVIMRKGTGLYLFKNGVLLDEDTIGAAETVYHNGVTPTTELVLGIRPGNTTHWAGWIDDFRLTKAARYPITGFPTPTSFPAIVRKDAGLFSSLGSSAIVEKVGITNASITNVSSSLYKGVLAGIAAGDVTIRDTYTEGAVDSAGDLAGGFIGDTGTNAGSTFTNTYSDVTVTGGGTDTGGWAGTFDGTPTYLENYGNTTKTASIVGTGAPGATEVSGLTTAQLTNEANYTGWDFVNTWEIDEGVSPATQQNDPTLPARILDATCDQSMIRYEAEKDQPTGIIGFHVPGQHIGFIYKFVGVRTERLEGTSWVQDAFTPAIQPYVPIKDGKALRGYWRWQKTMNGLVLETIETLHPKSFGSKFGGLGAPGGSASVSTSFGPSASDKSFNLVIEISNPRKIAKEEAQIAITSYGASQQDQVSLTDISRFIGVAKEPAIPVGENIVTSTGGGNSNEPASFTLVIDRNSGISIG